MSSLRASHLSLVLAGAMLMGCRIDVREGEHLENKEVDVRTPLGGVSVQSNGDAPDTGLPVYPGSRLRQTGDDPGSADVSINLPFVDLKVLAANYAHDDAPAAVLAFYRDALSRHGAVVECHGEIDFRGRNRPVCDERPFSRHTQLVVGTEDQHRMVVVKPRGAGSEFALVYVRTNGES